ncbi:MAG: hypothetical protein WC533_02425 [Candidatus Pacearchaeota archaeon]
MISKIWHICNITTDPETYRDSNVVEKASYGGFLAAGGMASIVGSGRFIEGACMSLLGMHLCIKAREVNSRYRTNL